MGKKNQFKEMLQVELEELKKLTEQGEEELTKNNKGIELELPTFIWLNDFISLAGSLLYERENNRQPNDIDIVVKAEDKEGKFIIVLDPSLKLKIDRILEKRFGKKSIQWIGNLRGANWKHKPIYDLALIPHKPEEVVEMNEPEFATEFYKRHSREKCMLCSRPPEYEILWAEGMAHAWFCKEHFKVWLGPDCKEHSGGFSDVDYVKEVKDGVAAKKFGDNPNPNIIEKVKAEFAKEWMNSPTFAYQAVYGKLPDTPLSGRTGSPKRIWNGVEVDEHLKDKWLDELNSIPEIEVRASDEGKSKERVAFIVFRMADPKDDCKVKAISDELNKVEGLYSKYDTGREGRLRIVVAGEIKYGDESFEKWWDSLADKIKGVLKGEIGTSKIKDLGLDKVKRGLYLVEPHGKLIYDRKKTAIVKVKNFDIGGEYFILVSDKKAYGYIQCSKGEEINLEGFKKRDKEHLISEVERKKWWPFKKTFYIYKILAFTSYDKPKDIILERGVQTFIEEVEFQKLHLKEFKRTGLDEDLRNPKERHVRLFADLRYLGNGAYPKIGKKGAWKEWTKEDILKYYAKIVDKLRSVWFPIIPPKIGDKEFSTSYWKCYRESKEYMETSPPEKGEVKGWDKKRGEIIKKVVEFSFKKVDKPEFIVGGVVYRSKKLDAQEDFARENEVWKALKKYMVNKRQIKVMHRGKLRDVPIVENYFVEENHHKGGSDKEHLLKTGDWWLSTYLGDSENKDIWDDVESGKLTGFSMAGKAHQFSTSYLGD